MLTPDHVALAALIISAIAAVFTLLQWHEGNRQADAAEASLRTASRSADAAEASATASKVLAQTAQRAWLVTSPPEVGAAENLSKVDVEVTITNVYLRKVF